MAVHSIATAALLAYLGFAQMAHAESATFARSPEAGCETISRSADKALAREIDPVVDDALGRGFAGQVAIIRNGTYVYSRAAGSADLGGEVPVRRSTLFHVASVSKYFTATLVLYAVDTGMIELDDPVAPLFERADPEWQNVTFADLLAHTSGLGSSYVAERHSDSRKALAAITRHELAAGGSGSFRYSNDGYDLLGILVERIFSGNYEDVARSRLLKPSCIGEAKFWSEADLMDPAAVSQPLKRIPRALRKRRNYGMAAALLISAEDLAAWQHALRTGSVLSANALQELHAPRAEMRIGQASYGAFIVDVPGLGHTIRALGYEDWGHNAMLSDFTECGYIVAVTTSRGPAENSGLPPFRQSIMDGIERVLATRCEAML
ncbi:MAG: serine hydrolase domain-containing protein [Pseudomonadota bacterium]